MPDALPELKEAIKPDAVNSVWLANFIREHGPALITELEQLREVVRKLPRTADGVTIVPGMKLYPLHPLPDEDLDGVEDCFEAVMSGFDSETCGDIEPDDLPLNYSSKDAASAARVALAAGAREGTK